MTDSTPTNTDALARLLAEKHECLAQLRALGGQQLTLIDESDLSDLPALIGEKQRWLERLQHIERALDPHRGQNPEERVWRTEADRRRCALLISQTETLYAEIVAQEKQSEQRLLARRDEAARRLQGAHYAGASRRAYSTDHVRRAGQLDLSSES